VCDCSDLYVYYTAAGRDDVDDLTYTRRIAVGHGGTLTADDDKIAISGPWTHETLLEPDSEWYEIEAQSCGMTYTFRGPWFFEDPATGETPSWVREHSRPSCGFTADRDWNAA